MTTGYVLTEDDFRHPVACEAYRPRIVPLLKAWFDCDVVEIEWATQFIDRNGDHLDGTSLHRAIQQDPQRQFEFYQTAISLLR